MNLEAIYKKHGILPHFRHEFDRLVHEAVIASKQFRVRLQTCQNYRDCLDEIVAQLSPIESLEL